MIYKDGDEILVEDTKNYEKYVSHQFLSPDEIVEDLINRLTDDDKVYIMTMEEDSLITLHFSFGMGIRNEYGLWAVQNPYTFNNDSKSVNGTSKRHPDNLSFEIIKNLYNRLK